MVKHSSRQSGTALLIALIMLFMMSIMGVTAMQTSSLEHRMATNAIEAKAVFQSAESVTEAALNSNATILRAIEAGVNDKTTETLKLDSNSTINSEATIQYIGSTLTSGFSFGSGTGYVGLRLIAVGEGKRENIGRAGITQGAVHAAPAS